MSSYLLSVPTLASEQVGAALGSGWWVAVVLGWVLLNAVFVATEFAILNMRPAELERAVKARKRGARQARLMTDRADRYLFVLRFGEVFCAIGVGATITWGLALRVMTGSGGSWILALSVFLLAAFSYLVVGVLVPRSIGATCALKVASWLAIPVKVLAWILFPLVLAVKAVSAVVLRFGFRVEPMPAGGPGHGEDDLRRIVEVTGEADVVTETEKDILLNTLELNDRYVRDIMTPRPDVIALDLQRSFQENLETILGSGRTRYPLVNGDLDEHRGLVHVKDLVSSLGEESEGAIDLEEVVRPATTVGENTPVDRLLAVFKSRGTQVAIVVDEFGGASGLVTLKDVLEEIVGDIGDDDLSSPPEVEAQFERLSEDEFVADGSVYLHDFVELSELDLEGDDVSTLGGYVSQKLGHLPEVGEQFELEGYEVTTQSADGRRVGELRFQRIAADEIEEV